MNSLQYQRRKRNWTTGMATSPAHQPASHGCSRPSMAVAYQLFTSSATWSRHTNGTPTA